RELLDKLAAEIGGGCHVVAHDLSESDRAAEWVPGAEAVHGPIDVLINNAGVELIALFAESDMARAEQLLRLNLITPLRLTRAILPGMVARKRVTIVDVASVAALAPPRGYCFYAASKAG